MTIQKTPSTAVDTWSQDASEVHNATPHRTYGWLPHADDAGSGKIFSKNGWWDRSRAHRSGLLILIVLVVFFVRHHAVLRGQACGLLGATKGVCADSVGQEVAVKDPALNYLIGRHQQLVAQGYRATRLRLISDPTDPLYNDPTNLLRPVAGQNPPSDVASDLPQWGYKVDVLLPSGQGRLPSLVFFKPVGAVEDCRAITAVAADPIAVPGTLADWDMKNPQPVDWSRVAALSGQHGGSQGCVSLADGKLLFYNALPVQ